MESAYVTIKTDKENVVYIHIETWYYSAIKNEIISFAGK
jgi:hypothetical protein